MPVHVRETWLSPYAAVKADSLFDLRHAFPLPARGREEFGGFCHLLVDAAHFGSQKALAYLYDYATQARFVINRRRHPRQAEEAPSGVMRSMFTTRVDGLIATLPDHPWTRLTGRLPRTTFKMLHQMTAASALRAGRVELFEQERREAGASIGEIWALADPTGGSREMLPVAVLDWARDHLPQAHLRRWLEWGNDARPEFRAVMEAMQLEGAIPPVSPKTALRAPSRRL
jgi:hypothetical protein